MNNLIVKQILYQKNVPAEIEQEIVQFLPLPEQLKKKNGKKKKSGNGLTAAQKKLPMALQRAILKRKKKGKK